MRKYDVLEQDRQREARNADYQFTLRENMEKEAELTADQLKMATFVALLDSAAEFKRFVEFCKMTVAPKHIRQLKEKMISHPADYLKFCDGFDAKKIAGKKRKATDAGVQDTTGNENTTTTFFPEERAAASNSA